MDGLCLAYGKGWLCDCKEKIEGFIFNLESCKNKELNYLLFSILSLEKTESWIIY